jgi:hypothetical protein
MSPIRCLCSSVWAKDERGREVTIIHRMLMAAAMTAVMAVGVAAPAAASPTTVACNGLQRAHSQTHDHGLAVGPVHDLWTANDCDHLP